MVIPHQQSSSEITLYTHRLPMNRRFVAEREPEFRVRKEAGGDLALLAEFDEDLHYERVSNFAVAGCPFLEGHAVLVKRRWWWIILLQCCVKLLD